MREIKFRGKKTNNGEWIYGGYVNQTDLYGTLVNVHYIIDGTVTIDYDMGEIYQVQPETIGQYTGLKDKNGVEIYEGDVLCYKDENYEDGIIGWEVFYEDGSFMASLTDGKDTFGGDFQLQEYAISDKLYCEVIGNIHEVAQVK